SGSMSLENFSPAWYLLENHQGASFEDLKLGLANMRLSSRSRSEGPTAFVKANIGAILDCLDSLNTMYDKFTQDDIQRGCIDSYAVSLFQAKSCADGLFQEVLGRKDQADQTRNALNVLQRFKFLFYLPLNMKRNIEKGDYSVVINDYIKARSLFAKKDVKVFQKVYKEVESMVESFRDMLRKKLMKLPNTLHEQKKIIGYLTSLEIRGDAAWECLTNQERWLHGLLVQCKTSHLEVSADPGSQKNSATLSVNYGRGSRGSSALGEPGFKFRTPQKVLFVEELTDIMTCNFPDFWKLGQAYISGQIGSREEVKPGKVPPGNKFKEMVSSLVKYFSNLIRAAFLPKSLATIPADTRKEYGAWSDSQDVSGAWLPHCVRYVRSCASSLCSQDLPGDCHDMIQELAFDMRTNCLKLLLNQAINDVRCLDSKETWMVELDDEFGGTTQLPALFENIVNEAIQHLHEVVVQNRSGESEIFSQRPVQKEATGLCQQLLEAFAPCLEHLALTNLDTGDQAAATLRPPAADKRTSYIEESTPEDTIPPKHKRLIIMLSNCNHTRSQLLPRLVENLNKHGYVEMNKVLQTCQATYKALDRKLFEAYIEEKSNPIVGVMEPHMYRGHFDWRHCKQPTDVRNYVKEVIMGLIEVHAEVFSISPAFVTPVMTRIVGAVSEEMSRLIQCVPELGTNGTIQAKLELMCLRDTVQLYQNKQSETSLREALEYLPDISEENEKKVEELMTTFRSQMKFQLMCFTKDKAAA
ncbi:hypothetical protein DPMN_178179, partial [Dreissena polymorpha]